MSIIFLGTSTCDICDGVLTEERDIYGFPPFVINLNDPIRKFSDNAYHRECLMKTEYGEIAVKYAELYTEKCAPSNRYCIVNGNHINKQEHHICILYLTSDTDDYLHDFNFTHIDKNNLLYWDKRVKVVEKLKELRRSGRWLEGAEKWYLDRLITQLEAV
jgi:hypothetical protein